LALFFNLCSFLLIVKVKNRVLKLELTIILDFKGSLHLVSKLHRSEIKITQRRNSKLAKDCLDGDQNRDLLVFLLLLTFKNDHSNVGVLFRFCQLLLDLAHELYVNINVFVWIELALHRCYRKHLFRECLLHFEVKAYGVLPLILQV